LVIRPDYRPGPNPWQSGISAQFGPAAWDMAVRNNESRDRRTHLREKLAMLAEK
jgi:hypothetical protein